MISILMLAINVTLQVHIILPPSITLNQVIFTLDWPPSIIAPLWTSSLHPHPTSQTLYLACIIKTSCLAFFPISPHPLNHFFLDWGCQFLSFSLSLINSLLSQLYLCLCAALLRKLFSSSYDRPRFSGTNVIISAGWIHSSSCGQTIYSSLVDSCILNLLVQPSIRYMNQIPIG